MSVDLRTELNDCDDATGFTDSNKAPGLNATVGQRYEGSGAIETQHTNSNNELDTTQTSGGGGTFSLNLSDSTCYLLLKDNLVSSAANGGVQFVLGDGTDKIGFDIAGNDAPGMDIPPYYRAFKLDVSNLPSGSNVTYTGIEANLTLTAITAMGVGTLHLAKAVGNVANIFCDAISYIANDSYALRINGGTVGTPETMADVQSDDASGLFTGIAFGGLVANPLGKQYVFFGPTEWGEPSATADHHFSANGEQWFWMGDNAGGHSVGATHFPFRVIGNSTDTASWKISNTSIVNTGTRAQFDMSSTNVETLEVDACSFTGLDTISAPLVGGTSRFCTNTIFSDCGAVTHNGANMSGSSVLLSNVATDDGALFYDQTTDPDGVMDNMKFSKGANAHHAIRFGTSVPAELTLRGCTFTGFGSTDDANDSVFRFDDIGGSITLNLVDCTTDGAFSVDDAAGVTVTVVIDPVTTLVNVKDNKGNNLINARVLVEASDDTGDFPFEETVGQIVRSGATATVTHTGHNLKTNDIAVIRGAGEQEYNGPFAITKIDNDSYSYTVTGTPSTPASGTIISSGGAISGLTNGSGNISSSRTFTLSQPVKGTVRKSTGTPRFKNFLLGGVINNADGLTINVRMVKDE